MLRLWFLTAMLAVGLGFASHAQAKINCNTHYVVQRGDTLTKIARQVYGSDDASLIHNANFDVIGRNAWLIEIGVELWIPCGEEQALAAVVGATAPAPGSLAGVRSFRVLSGPVRAPLIGPAHPQNGLLGEMLFQLGEFTGLATEAPVHVPVAGSSLSSLLTVGGFDIGFPWTRPDCDGAELDESRRAACKDLLFTDPFYDAEMGIFTLPGGKFAEAVSFDDLKGAHVCRPMAVATDDLHSAGLGEAAMLMRPDTEESCLQQLREGAVDLVSIDSALAEIAIERNGWANEVERLPISTHQMLHAAVSRNHPDAQALVSEINRGLEFLRKSGAWFGIAHRHMSLHRKVASRI